MADIINLKLHKKRQARAEKESEAAANRAKFGQTKPERKLNQAKTAQQNKSLDDHKREE